ncbi:hypothetical protein Tco_1449419 [Tanacetum coccineum]
MMVQAQEEMGEGSAMPTDLHHTPIIQPSTSQPQKKQSRRKQRKDTKIPQSSGPTMPMVDEAANEENVATQSNDLPLLRVNTLGSREDRLKLKELMDLYTKLSDRVLALEIRKTAQAKEIEVVSSEDEEQSEKVVEKVVSTDEVSAAATITTEKITLAQALAELRSVKPKDKGKAKIIEPEKPLKMKEQIKLDEELAFKLQVKEEEQARLAREKDEKVEEANISWDNVLFVELLEKRKKHFASLRAQEKRNKPPTKAQKKLTMSTYLKHMASYKQSQLKNKSFAKIQKLFDKAMTRVNMLVNMDTEIREGKKQKIDNDQEEAEMKNLIKVVLDEEEVAIDAIPLATKPPSIVDWKIVKEGKISLFQIIRANGSSKRYSSMIQMLRDFDREDLETLWKLVKAKHGSTRPEEGYERVLWGDLRTMFEHNIEDTVWRNLLGNKVLIWKLFDSCGVHFVRFQDMHLFMLVEKRYPLTPATIIEMLNKKLQTDHLNEMCYQLLKLMTKQLKKQ